MTLMTIYKIFLTLDHFKIFSPGSSNPTPGNSNGISFRGNDLLGRIINVPKDVSTYDLLRVLLCNTNYL